MLLSELVKKAKEVCLFTPLQVSGDAEIISVSGDSRNVSHGSLFVCMTSSNTKTHDFLPEIVQSGAVACIVHSQEGFEKAQGLGIASVLLPSHPNDFIKQLCYFLNTYYDDPSLKLKLIGITGTSGKSTVAWILRDALQALNNSSVYFGTLGFRSEKENYKLLNTTSYPLELWPILDGCVKHEHSHVVMEVSSEGLSQNRLAALHFDLGLFTNFSQDHLDYHKTMEAYQAAKKTFFTQVGKDSLKQFVSVINVDDPVGQAWAKEFRQNSSRVLTFGLTQGDIQATIQNATLSCVELLIDYNGSSEQCYVPLGGHFNIMNALSAVAALIGLGYSLEESCRAMRHVTAVPGRLEFVQNSRNLDIIVDYAHKPEALEKLLQTVKPLCQGRVITVFGAGGDRDRSKRPVMAKIASALSDICVLTSDNPRTEDPVQIIQEVQSGLVENAHAEIEVDRRKAIELALKIAKSGDTVLVVGKGHEDYQIIGRQKFAFDDRQVIREALIENHEIVNS